MLNNLYNRFRRITSNQLYFPEIDGIRFLAILLVVLFHAHGYFTGKTQLAFSDTPGSHDWIDNFLSKGDRGVELFFVLSGFILCMPFAHHYINHGKPINLKKYYLRRVTRLEPPYILAITGIFILQRIMHVNPNHFTTGQLMQHFAASLTYTHGLIFQMVPIITVVAWSLEIEIQFYVMAPLLFRVLTLSPALRRSLLVAGVITMTLLQHAYMPQFLYFTIYRLIQYFFIGILLADLYVSDTFTSVLKGSWVIPCFIVILSAICVVPLKTELYAQLLFPFLVGTLYIMIMKNDQIKRVFSYKFIPVIGGMCYSIYLLHYTVISVFGRFTIGLKVSDRYLPNLVFQLVVLSLLALIVSSIFYLFVERPFMDQKWTNKLMKKDPKNEGASVTP